MWRALGGREGVWVGSSGLGRGTVPSRLGRREGGLGRSSEEIRRGLATGKMGDGMGTEFSGREGGGLQATGELGGKMKRYGVLVPLKTVQETRRKESTIEVFVTVVDVKMASRALSLIKILLPDDGGLDLQHLRRFVKFEDVREEVREAFRIASNNAGTEGSKEALAVPTPADISGLASGAATSLASPISPPPESRTREQYSASCMTSTSDIMPAGAEAGQALGREAAATKLALSTKGSDMRKLSRTDAQTSTHEDMAAEQAQDKNDMSSRSQPASNEVSRQSETPTTIKSAEASKRLVMIIGSVNAISHAAIREELEGLVGKGNSTVFPVPVPHLAPTSSEQAARLTVRYWPTIYKKSNPFGPHPSIVAHAEVDLYSDIEKWMTLAWEVARQSYDRGIGERIGVVVVERVDGVGKPVAVAADARWNDWERTGSGNPTAHAVLRAIAMVANGVRNRRTADHDAEFHDTAHTDLDHSNEEAQSAKPSRRLSYMPGTIDSNNFVKLKDPTHDNVKDGNMSDAKELVLDLLDTETAARSDSVMMSTTDRNSTAIKANVELPRRQDHLQRHSPSEISKFNENLDAGRPGRVASDPDCYGGNKGVHENRIMEHVGNISGFDNDEQRASPVWSACDKTSTAVVGPTDLMDVPLAVKSNLSQETPAAGLVESKLAVREENASSGELSVMEKTTQHPEAFHAKEVENNSEQRKQEDEQLASNTGLVKAATPSPSERIDIFQDQPILEIEQRHFDPSGNQSGYLCHNLEIYCTHEPCIMCAMAIVHSRFGKLIFEQRMPRTGGMCADGHLGHGLFWRKELNWTMLAWHLNRDGASEETTVPDLHA